MNLNLLADILKKYLHRRTKIMKFLDELNAGWGGFNTMHIFLAYLQRAPPEERPLVAAILFQLDLLVISFDFIVSSSPIQ